MAASWDGSAWAATTPYLVNARVVNVGNVYLCTSPGTSAGAGGPTGTTAAIADNTVTWAYVGAFSGSVLDAFPVLATPAVAASSQSLFLAMAERRAADPDVWGSTMDDGVRALAAHFAFLAKMRGSGATTSESVGPISRSYASLAGPFALSLTPAGQAYLDILRSLPTAFGLVV